MANVLCINVFGGLYLTAEGRSVAGAAAQPRRLAVLALLAVAGERAMTRERILSYLWPDMDDDRGRHALTQSLYALRHDLDADELFLGLQEVRLNPDLITSDYVAFHDAIRAGAPERAVEYYRGPFLQGFHLPRADNFERWVDEQRDALDHEYGSALEAAAGRATERRNHQAAVGYLKRRAAQDPLNGRVAVKLMEALTAQGAIVAALQHARVHAVMVRQELDLAPDPEVLALAERIRTAPRVPTIEAAPDAGPPPAPATESDADDSAVEVRPGQDAPVADRGATPADVRRWRVPAAITLLVLVAVSLAIGLPRRAPSLANSARPVIAVGLIADYSSTQPGGLGRPLADMLATNLARGSGYRVISNARMLELMGQLKAIRDTSGIVSAAARHAGAAELIDGSLYATAPNRYRLDLRRVDLTTGAMIHAYRVEGADLFALVDSGTLGLVPDLGGAAPETPLAQVSTASVEAYQSYEQGLHRYYDQDLPRAERLFRHALDLDSLFAQAAYYFALATTSGSRTESLDRMRRAVELSPRASDRERLVIQATWAANNSSATLAALADTLMIRYPEEVDGYLFGALGANLLGDFSKAIPLLRRVLELDSLGSRSPGNGRCRVCEAYEGLGYSYNAMDSQPRLRAMVHEWVRRQPSSGLAWGALAGVYAQQARPESAMIALRIADSLEPGSTINRPYRIAILSTLQHYPEVERMLRTEMQIAPNSMRRITKWDLAVTYRKMGRLREALPLAHEYRMGIQERLLPGAASYQALLEGQVLFEMRRYRSAAALFDSIAVGQSGEIEPSLRARDRIWAWVHEADAVAQLGDTARLRFLADSMEVLGQRVAHARDRVLHAHVRGLLARMRGQDEQAAQWFRRAIVSPVLGFTRSNYELGAVYLRIRRPHDAVNILRQATYAGTDGSGLYVTQTDVEARLAEAFDSAGQADSALYFYRRVLNAWAQADRQFWPRRDSLAATAARLEGASRR